MLVGEDWDLIDVKFSYSKYKGVTESESQYGTVNHNKEEPVTVFNIPFNAMYRTLDIMGWPKIVLKFEGPDEYGTNIVKGYATCSIPLRPGTHNI